MSNPELAKWICAMDDTALPEGHMTAVYPVPSDLGHEALPPMLGAYMGNIGMFMAHVRTESMRAYRTRLEAGWVEIAMI